MANLNFVNVYVDSESVLKASKKNQLKKTVVEDGRDEISNYVWLEYEGADKEPVRLLHEVKNNRTNSLEFAVEKDDIVIWRAIPIKSAKTNDTTDEFGDPITVLESFKSDDDRFDVLADAIFLGDLFNPDNPIEPSSEEPNTMIDRIVFQGLRNSTGNGKSAAGVVNRAEKGDEQGYNVGLEIIDKLNRGGESTVIEAELDPLLRGKQR